mmetsp:Transcript_16147/g.32689  ORF Transcript_16147/g.32689 Transcript_16147/m.32689 type:complete len:309 (-) Transcript_16147:754-1680(-)
MLESDFIRCLRWLKPLADPDEDCRGPAFSGQVRFYLINPETLCTTRPVPLCASLDSPITRDIPVRIWIGSRPTTRQDLILSFSLMDDENGVKRHILRRGFARKVELLQDAGYQSLSDPPQLVMVMDIVAILVSGCDAASPSDTLRNLLAIFHACRWLRTEREPITMENVTNLEISDQGVHHAPDQWDRISRTLMGSIVPPRMRITDVMESNLRLLQLTTWADCWTNAVQVEARYGRAVSELESLMVEREEELGSQLRSRVCSESGVKLVREASDSLLKTRKDIFIARLCGTYEDGLRAYERRETKMAE